MAQAKVNLPENAGAARWRDRPVWRSRLVWRGALLAGSLAVIAAVIRAYGADVTFWALETQRVLLNELARAVRAVRAGEAWALGGLIGACFVYGVVHAVGPGHGKMVISGAAAASRRTMWRMASIGFSASIIQGFTAILLAYGGLGLLSLTQREALGLAENWLAPLSAAAIALLGLWILQRGLRDLWRAGSERDGMGRDQDHDHHHQHGHAADGHDHHHEHDGRCASGCRHGPTVKEAEAADGWGEAAWIALGIGARPCSGALIVLATAWYFGLYVAGVLSALAMAVGTGLVVGGVAVLATSFRDAQSLRGADQISRTLFAWVRIAAGAAVALFSGLLVAAAFL